jgi:hypothetical protein
MAPANPVPQDRSGDSAPTLDQSSLEIENGPGSFGPGPEPVSQEELNAWRRGLTPQAEIWNGRLAMLGLSMGLLVLILSRLIGHHS